VLTHAARGGRQAKINTITVDEILASDPKLKAQLVRAAPRARRAAPRHAPHMRRPPPPSCVQDDEIRKDQWF